LCVGFAEIIDPDQNTSLTIFGDEIITENVEGMAQGEAIEFRVFRNITHNEVIACLEFDSNYNNCEGLFAEDGLSVIKNLNFKSTSIFENINHAFSLFPNPSKGLVTFTVDNNLSNYHLTISDLNGQTIVENDFSGNIQIDLSVYPKGFYLVMIKGYDGTKIEKLILE